MASTLLAVWLILYGLGHFVAIPQLGLVLGVLALVVGLLMLVGR
jgi:hypothetical protein